MKKISILLFILIAFVLSGCSANSPQDITRGSLSGYKYVYPEKIEGALHNPGMGWITLEEQTELGKMDLGRNGDLPEIDVIGIQTSWALIEKTDGIFDWHLIDEAIAYWTARGKRINLRICTDSLNLPEVYYGAPKWINEEPYNVHYEEYTYSGEAKARVNDLTDPNYQNLFERFMKKLSERYADNPYIDTVDIRGFGMYGEWHSGHSFKNMNERMQTLAYIIDKYAENFTGKNKVLFLSSSWDYQGVNEDGSNAITHGHGNYEDYIIWSALDHGMKLEYIGYRRDGGAGNGVTKYETDEKIMSDFVRSGKKVPLCGEFFTGYDDYKEGIFGMDPLEAIEEIIFKLRPNYCTVMGWVNIEVARIIDAGDEEVFNRGNQKMGYRFAVDMARYEEAALAGSEISVLLKLSNSGVGRFWLQDHFLKLYLLTEDGLIKGSKEISDYDLRNLLNGETGNVYTKFKIPAGLEKGEYLLAVAIVDEYGNPAIRLGQAGDHEKRIYPLGTIEIGRKVKPKVAFTETTYEKLTNYKWAKNSVYEVTFEYLPSFKLEDYQFGSKNGYQVQLTSKKGGDKANILVANFQDVSGEPGVKTVTFATGNYSDYRLEIFGTGEYREKIEIGKVYIEKKGGYLERFENYNLYSINSAWYSLSEDIDTTIQDALEGKESVLLTSNLNHAYNDLMSSDPNLLKLKPKTAYTISFKTKGIDVGGNGAFYYLKLADNGKEVMMIGEWYDRPDEPLSTKSFTLITPNLANLELVFGIKNRGGFMLDELNISECGFGSVLEGESLGYKNNVRPYDPEKGFAYLEGFEDLVLNDSIMTYGFNRWGSFTTDVEEVISGKVSFTSRLPIETYHVNKDSEWFEFSYSNPKYLRFKANTTYTVSFKYRVVEKPISNVDGSTPGYFYFLTRSTSGQPDVGYVSFGQNPKIGAIETFTTTFTTGNSDDYKLILGTYGRGTIIYDDIIVSEN